MTSIEVQAEDMLRLATEPLTLEELELLANNLRGALVAIADGLASHAWSAPARYNAMHLVKRIAVRLDEVLSAIDDRRCDEAALAEAGALEPTLAPPMP